jgi:mRNA interferase HicA
MTGAEFLRRLRRLGRRRGIAVRIDPEHGKGSHGRIYYGSRSTTIPALKRELGAGLLRALCRELEVDLNELRRV